MEPRLAIIIVTHNGEQYVEELFSSFAADTFPKDRLGIFVVDNSSTDGTVESIKYKVSSIKGIAFELIKNAKNEGFARGNNIAIRRALDEGYEWVMLLNQDTVVKSGFIKEVLAVAQSDERIGAVQLLLLLWPPERAEINSLGNEIHFLGFGYCKGYRQPLATCHLPLDTSGKELVTSGQITYASGAAVLFRAVALRDVGLFDEDFFMYHEDLDLGWRFQLRGWKSMLAPKAMVYHKYDFKAAPYKYYFMERNRLIVTLQNYKFATLVLIAPAFLLMEIGMLGFSFIRGWWKEKLRGYWWVATHLPTVINRRTEIQKNRTASDRTIAHRFVGTISYQEIESPALRYIANPIFSSFWAIARMMIYW